MNTNADTGTATGHTCRHRTAASGIPTDEAAHHRDPGHGARHHLRLRPVRLQFHASRMHIRICPAVVLAAMPCARHRAPLDERAQASVHVACGRHDHRVERMEHAFRQRHSV